MTTPPGLLGAALFFWGWQSGLVLFGAIIAVILEGSRIVVVRWDLDRSDFNRVADLCILVFLAMAAYLFANSGVALSPGASLAILVLFTWLPLAFAPLVVSQAYSVKNEIDLGTLLLLLRRRAGADEHKARETINLTYPYFALCLLSASAANVRTPLFYIGLCMLSAWALWSARSKSFSAPLWVTLMLCVAFVGFGGQLALHSLQKVVEGKFVAWYLNSRTDTDPYRRTTAIGDLGRIKLSGRILLRLEPSEQSRPPLLLRSAAYNIYRSSTWFAAKSAFERVQPEPDGTTWKLEPRTASNTDLAISAYLKRGKCFQALPKGNHEIK